MHMDTFLRKFIPLRCRQEGKNPQMQFSTICLCYTDSSRINNSHSYNCLKLFLIKYTNILVHL